MTVAWWVTIADAAVIGAWAAAGFGIFRLMRHRAQTLARLQARPQARLMSPVVSPEQKARELLLSALSPGQRYNLTRHGWFEVISNKGHRWVIRADVGVSYNVYHNRYKYCAHIRGGSVPKDDHLLAQALMLRTDENQFLRIANKQRISPRETYAWTGLD